jgi:hypothetical protein
MNTYDALFNKRLFFALTLVCAVGFLASGWSKATRRPLQKEIRVNNSTESFQVIATEKAGNDIKLRMKNVSHKNINAYTLSVNESGFITVDYTISGYMIVPGEIVERTVPFDETSTSEPNLGVVALVFTDNTSEGQRDAVTKIKNTRKGEKKQLNRILPILRNALNVSNADLPTALDGMKTQVLTLTERAEESSSRAESDAVYDIKQEVLRLLEEFSQRRGREPSFDRGTLKQELTKALKNMEERAARL